MYNIENEMELTIPMDIATRGTNDFFFKKTLTFFKERIEGRTNRELVLGRRIIDEIYKNPDENINGTPTGRWNTDFPLVKPEKKKKIGSRFTSCVNEIYPALQLAGDYQVYAETVSRFICKDRWKATCLDSIRQIMNQKGKSA